MIYVRDSITNETCCDMTDVKEMEEFLREQRLQQFEHMERRDDKRAPVKAKKFVVEGSRKG